MPARLHLGPSDRLREEGSGVRSHLADGRGVAWLVPEQLLASCAVDAELAGQPVSGRIARRAGSTDPGVVWPRWTRCEITAKLLDLPVLSWLEWPGLIVPGAFAGHVQVRHVRVEDVVVCCGFRTGA